MHKLTHCEGSTLILAYTIDNWLPRFFSLVNFENEIYSCIWKNPCLSPITVAALEPGCDKRTCSNLVYFIFHSYKTNFTSHLGLDAFWRTDRRSGGDSLFLKTVVSSVRRIRGHRVVLTQSSLAVLSSGFKTVKKKKKRGKGVCNLWWYNILSAGFLLLQLQEEE